jgi:hypothetical protein
MKVPPNPPGCVLQNCFAPVTYEVWMVWALPEPYPRRHNLPAFPAFKLVYKATISQFQIADIRHDDMNGTETNE